MNFEELIEKYKKHVIADNNVPEKHKWVCIRYFQDNFNIDAPDFASMFKDAISKKVTLLYQNSAGFILRAALYFPEEVRKMFKELYDESKELKIRYRAFLQSSERLLPEVIVKYGKKLNHQQDERTISFYLAMRYPEKYPLFKDDIYKLLLDSLGIVEVRPAGEKYFHFLELAKKVLPLIESDNSLNELVRKTLNAKCYQGELKYIIFQDILWRGKKKQQYFVAACLWGPQHSINKTSEFLENGFWQTDYDEESEQGKKIYALLKEVNVGDQIAIRYFTRNTGTAEITGIGEVISTDEAEAGKLLVNWLENVSLYNGPIPTGQGAGNWWETLIQLKRKEDIEKIFAAELISNLNGSSQSSEKSTAKNIILYGPPGTGKTFTLREHYLPLFTDKKKLQTKEEYIQEVITALTWWETIIAAFYDLGKKATVPELAVHPFIQIRQANSMSKNLPQVLWGQLQYHTVEECTLVKYTKRQEPLIFNKQPDSQWELLEEKANVEVPHIKSLVQSIHDFKPKEETFKRYSFVTFHQSFTYEDFVEGIKPKMNDVMDLDEEQLSYHIRKGIFYVSCENAAKLAGYASLKECIEDNTENRKQKLNNAPHYAILIDEINRGNIASVLGELITLIEDDKRLGAIHELCDIELPYSKEKFGVPCNLHIIGTMNTADRSVESLDTALRRRFYFKSIPPSIEPIKVLKVGNISISEVLNAVNNRIALLLNHDYMIGHSYFIGISTIAELKNVFQNKIIPLLQEYFYNDYGKVGLILGPYFIKPSDKKVQFADGFNHENKEELLERTTYYFTDSSDWTEEAFVSIYK